MLTFEFNYDLPKNLIAQKPADPRDSSRLMVIDRRTKTSEGHHFFDIVNYLQAGDLLVWNDSKVFKARLHGTIEVNSDVATGHGAIFNVPEIEIFLVRPMENPGVWKVLAKPGRKLRLGMRVRFAPDFSCEIMVKEKDGTILVQFNDSDLIVREKANRYGDVPTPPYVQVDQTTGTKLAEQYQTVYAKSEGSVAAPTAGFHFTTELIEKLKAKGVEFAEVTLHVGLGTFLPVKSGAVENHHMHAEYVELTDKNALLIKQAKAEGRRVVAVGTTTVRTLEGIYSKFGGLIPYSSDIDIFILPGFKFNVVDALITNFHLPESTLLMLVCAFVHDKDFMLECYQNAVRDKYRFFSFGDAMLIK
ncbi:MAG: tRNA preQ1(34) S-adenosylmethionine ribosyltransferase-isomerase QueA [bacterium]|nr:tRNA preQ1(34) S-adenosylmethionine ribosyltransferase-isomerase QueA [bacterium]